MASSRLCVKHLPKHVNEENLRSHFSGKWTLTDVKLIRTKEGASRQFGFLGFQTPEDAEAARAYFDRSFLGASRLSLEFARSFNESKLVRPWSKHSQGSSAHGKVHGVDSLSQDHQQQKKITHRQKEVLPSVEDGPKLREFLQLMQPRSRAWGNDDDPGIGTSTQTCKDGKTDSTRESGSDEGASNTVDKLIEAKDGACEESVLSNMDYLKSRMTSNFGVEPSDVAPKKDSNMSASSTELEELSSDECLEDSNASNMTDGSLDEVDGGLIPEAQPKDVNSAGRVHNAKQIFVRNLPYTASETDLLHIFEPCGDIVELSLAKDRSERSKGFAIITFAEAEAASEALCKLDGYIFRGRLIHVLPGMSRKDPSTESDKNAEGLESGFKAERDASRKANAGNRSAWNSLFMRPDTVAEAIAEHYGVQKRDLMDRDASDLGVRMALGETQVINKTKAELRESGVDVDLLEEAAHAAGKASDSIAVARSSRVLLIKNLPFKADEHELLELLASIGHVVRLVLPTCKAIALVEYGASSDAIKAFRSLAYKNYHGAPLYLEWAPKGIFNRSASQLQGSSGPLDIIRDGDKNKKRNLEEGEMETEERDSGDEDQVPTKCLFVKNLSFSTTESVLKKHFDKVVSEVGGTLRSVALATKLRTDGKRTSAGYGFVEVDSDNAVKHVIRRLQGSLLDGHKIELQKSLPKSGGPQVASIATNSRKRKKDQQKTSKLLIRNLAFESTKKDLLGLFGPFGHIRTCRIPRKFDGTHRGFAFIDFITKQEAENAKDGVSGVHLYGRRLVIEYAKDDNVGLEALRVKTSNQFNGEGVTDSGQKKMKK